MDIIDWVERPFNTLLELWESLQKGLKIVTDMLLFKIPNPYAYLPEWLKTILERYNPFFKLTPDEESVSLLSLLIGGAIGAFIVLTIVKWIIGIIQ